MKTHPPPPERSGSQLGTIIVLDAVEARLGPQGFAPEEIEDAPSRYFAELLDADA